MTILHPYRRAFSLSLMAWLALARPPEVRANELHLRPATDCPIAGDGSAHACAATAGGAGALNSFAAAQAAAEPGDVVRLDGDFQLTALVLWRKSGTAAAPIRLTSYDPDAPARLRGPLSAVLLYLEADHLEVDHLRFNNTAQACLYVGKDAAPADRWTGMRVHHNHFERCWTGMSISDVEDAEIHDNLLENISDDPSSSNKHHCIYPAQGARNIRVYRNVCRKAVNETSSHCLHVYHAEPPGPAEDVDFHDNICLGFEVAAGVYNNSSGIRIYNNTFYTSDASSRGLVCRYGGSQAEFANNIIYGDMTSMTYIDPAICQLEIDHNLYYDPGGPPVFSLVSGALGVSDWQALGYDANSVIGDAPLLTEPGAGNVRLLSGSPAIDAGDPLYSSPTDAYGGPRVLGSAIDIGAAEYGDTADRLPAAPTDLQVE